MQNLNALKPIQSQQYLSVSRSFSMFTFVGGLILAVGICITVNYFFFTPRIAYVNTGKLLIGFSEANKIEKEVKIEDDKWREQFKQLTDSVQPSMGVMNKEFN